MATSVQSSGTTGTTGNSALDALMGTKKTASTSEAGSADQFLNLLVAQLKNQDPLNPMDNAQMTSQLAQINTVKGIGEVNTNLQKLVGSYSDVTSMQAANLVGRSVLVPGSDLYFPGIGGLGIVNGGVELAEAADQVTVVIKNAAGTEVGREELGKQKAGVVSFAWDGKKLDPYGKKYDNEFFDEGNYTFSVEAKQGDKKVTATALEVGSVSALVKTQSGFQLDIGGGGRVDFNTVKQIF